MIILGLGWLFLLQLSCPLRVVACYFSEKIGQLYWLDKAGVGLAPNLPSSIEEQEATDMYIKRKMFVQATCIATDLMSSFFGSPITF